MRKVILLLMTTLFLGGCGSSGSVGGSGDNIYGYTGNTNQATVTASNAKAVSVDAIEGVQTSATLGVLSKSVNGTQDASPQIQQITNIVQESVVDVFSKPTIAKTVAETIQGTLPSYSGSCTYSISANETTGAASGSFTFDHYQEQMSSPHLSGNLIFSGIVNVTSGDIINFDITVSNFTVTSATQALILNGKISTRNSSTFSTLNVSMVQKDSLGDKTYWMKDFNLQLAGNSMTITGTYYNYQYGYVGISTITPLAVTAYSSKPVSGQLLFTGSNGTKARVTFTSTGYTVEVDASGNDTYALVQ